ncbi:translation initiation factor IF-3 [Candidatus Roizmanbacteria bacterium RIFCSPLOWO2_01_FULL_37_12]|uniref:Translation initiation factor IF-3 n=1 Tax=Candidatus Roizmanbacteria bacterium RIFCSPLOWO2_01_FULL_37_12 TaxID=1802056 RepID=A0A1F7IB88_9BACT|nr:MAG: translation initiation factor IF-3 [Candidatus Roizmanbacteria bacterium RIFCSPHIGHO2_01_FULL_37_16]OGK25431.1 MAG: translation initiation factor IF-3 [Candidatus Roizmanbacteria bacterium RIFCSPHIGHO2_02_FULL_37_9b]OGK40625.1 MAG: translation initiation factor IF-3 [Candidatus Roizmanbacteria bacterium RIFCSPLOWO2_01_FULL_37_12]
MNHRIEAPTLRVIDKEGKQIGVLSKYDALRKAQELESDLVLIAPSAKPPVAKIIDFKKFLYQEEKKLKESKKGIKKSTVKNIKLSLFIAESDLNRLIARTKEFLDEGNQVRINLLFRGREIGKRQMGFDLINKFLASLGDINVSKEPRLMGRIISTVVFRRK